MRNIGLLAVLALVLSGCGSDPGDSAVRKLVPGAQNVVLEGQRATLTLPSGQFEFTFAKPAQEVPGDSTENGKPLTAASGTDYLGIQWTQTGPAPAFGAVLHGTDPLPAAQALSVAGNRIELPPVVQDPQGSRPEGTVFVRVPDDASSTLEVTYDGLSVDIDTTTGDVAASPADQFAQVEQTDSPDCATDSAPDARFRYDVRCHVSKGTLVPYVAGAGWTQDEARWLVVDATVTPGSFTYSDTGTDEVRYRIDTQAGTIASDSGEGVVVDERELQSQVFTATYAVPVTGNGPWQLTLNRSYQLSPDAGPVGQAPAQHQVEFTGSVTVHN
ncbi:MAG: hypothetical protein V9G04_03205 [Nocardioides sp.]|jgi:hypothetical protein